jgi:hypothetical protein
MKQKTSFHSLGSAAAITILAFFLTLPKTSQADFLLPGIIRENVEVISTFDSKQVVTPTDKAAYAEQQHVYTNLIGNALKPEGDGGVYEGKILKVKKEFPIYRVYTKKGDPETGRNNRFGGWWTHVPPGKGISKADYRRRYEICESFNRDLDLVVQCWIYPGALLLIGPGQSVSEGTCRKPGESYASDTGKDNLQIYIPEMFKHNFLSRNGETPLQDSDHYIGCPAESDDRSFDWYCEGKAPLNDN